MSTPSHRRRPSNTPLLANAAEGTRPPSYTHHTSAAGGTDTAIKTTMDPGRVGSVLVSG